MLLRCLSDRRWLLLACALLCAPAARADEADLSPLGLRIQGTLRELFLDVIGGDARPLLRPSLEVRYALANDWGQPTNYLRHDTLVSQELDEQADSITLSARVPWASVLGRSPVFDRLSTALEARGTLHWGGFSDGAIETWHDLTGAFNFDRDKYPRGAIAVSLKQAGGPAAFDVHSATAAFGDLVARTQFTFAQGGYSAGPLAPGGELRPAWALALRLDLKLPTGSLASLGGSGGLDAGVALLGTAELLHWLTGHALLAASALSGWSSSIALQPKPWQATAEISLAAGAGGWSFLLEDRFSSPLLLPGWERVEDGGNDGYLSSTVAGAFRPHNQVSWGIRRAGFTLWLSEDFTPGANPRGNMAWLYNSNHPDVVVGLGFRHAL